MSDNVKAHDLNAIEREIALTRARLKANIATLTSDATMGDLKTTIKSEVLESKDEALAFAGATASDLARRGYETLKQKAAANPAAAAMIGAGIAWKLWKNPPVAAALAGVGLFSLFSSRENDPLRSTANFVRETAEETASAVKDTASSARDTVRRATHDLEDKLGAFAGSAKEQAQELFGSGSKVPFSASPASSVGVPNGMQRQVLLSLAGAAVAAAVGVAVHRARSESA